MRIYENLLLTYRKPKQDEELELAEIRARAMKESLIHVGRFDEKRVRQRLLDTFCKYETIVLEIENEIIGFYSVHENVNEYYLNHLYIDPKFQNKGFGTIILNRILKEYSGKDIRLNALKESLANEFYIKHGFIKEKEDQLDNYYVFRRIG